MKKNALRAFLTFVLLISTSCKTADSRDAGLASAVSPQNRVNLLNSLSASPTKDELVSVFSKILPGMEAASRRALKCEIFYADFKDPMEPQDPPGRIVGIGAMYKNSFGSVTPWASLFPTEKIYRPFKLGERFSFPRSFLTEIAFSKPGAQRNAFQLSFVNYSFYGEWFASKVTRTRAVVEFDAVSGKAISFNNFESVSNQHNLTGLFSKFGEETQTVACDHNADPNP